MKTTSENKVEKKLNLTRETLRVLSDAELRLVVGACTGGMSSEPNQ